MASLSAAAARLIGVICVNAALELLLPPDKNGRLYFRIFAGLYILSILLTPLGQFFFS
jgi:hypothetical protein